MIEEYAGWAPCVHSPEEETAFQEWIKTFLPERFWKGWTDLPPHSNSGGMLEMLLWWLQLEGVQFSLDCEQWVQVTAWGKVGDREFRTEIQGDSFLIAMAETYRWWKAKTKELTGEEWS